MSEETLGLISLGLLGPLVWSSWRVWNSWTLGASWCSDMRGSSFRVVLVRWMRFGGWGDSPCDGHTRRCVAGHGEGADGRLGLSCRMDSFVYTIMYRRCKCALIG